MGAVRTEPQLKAATRTDIKKFQKLTEFVLDKIGIEPQWHVTVTLDQEDELPPGAAAKVVWVTNYRDVEIFFEYYNLKDRRGWLRHLLHELVHVQMHAVDAYLQEHSGSLDTYQGIMESTVSEIANTQFSLFNDAYYDEYKKWL